MSEPINKVYFFAFKRLYFNNNFVNYNKVIYNNIKKASSYSRKLTNISFMYKFSKGYISFIVHCLNIIFNKYLDLTSIYSQCLMNQLKEQTMVTIILSINKCNKIYNFDILPRII